MKSRHLVAVMLAAAATLSSCASVQEYRTNGNAIIVARFDTRVPGGGEGRWLTDNAGGIPSLAANAAGLPTTPAAGAAIDIGVAALANYAAGEAAKGKITIAFKYLFENTCKYGIHYVDLRDTPEAEKLFPGHIAQWADGRDTRNWGLVPASAVAGQPAYLTKTHPCYEAWVKEWKEHQRLLALKKGRDWDSRRAPTALLFAKDVPVESIPDPVIPWVR